MFDDQDDQLPPGARVVQEAELPPGATLVDPNLFEQATEKLYTTPEGVPVYKKPAWIEPEGSALQRGAKGLWATTGGGILGLIKSVANLGAGGPGVMPAPGSPAWEEMSKLVMSHVDQAEKAKAAWQKGRYSEAFGHSAATILPFLGPGIAAAGESFGSDEVPQFDRYGNVVKQGRAPDVAGGVGQTAGLLGMSVAPAGLEGYRNVNSAYQAGHAMGGLPPRPLIPTPRIPRLAPSLTSPLFRSRLNPVERRAMGVLLNRGIPVRAGVQTGNKFLKAAEQVVEHTPLGSQQAAQFREGTEQGLHQFGQELMDEAHPTPETPESAATAVRSGLDARIKEYGDYADQAYGDAWKGRGKQQFTERRKIGTDRDGSTIEADVNMPVDVTELQDAAQALYEELDWSLSKSEMSQSKAASVLEKILKGAETVPAWVAERGLSALKEMARTKNKSGVRDYAQGTAAHLIKVLQEKVDAAVAKTGPEAIEGLRTGRSAHADMMDVVEVAEELLAEPVQAFGQMTWAHDSGIARLRRIATNAPETMTQIGRAFIQQLFDKATREGGITRTRSTLDRWRDMGEQTKELLFPDPALRSKLDGFFKGLDMVVDKINTSGTEVTRQATSLNPIRWAAGYIGGKVLYTPRGIALLTEALRTPAGSAKARLIQRELSVLARGTAATAGSNRDERRPLSDFERILPIDRR